MDATTQQTLDGLSNELSAAMAFQKSYLTTTGLVNYDLQEGAKNLYPVNTPLRNRTPRVDRSAKGGTATNWKKITGIAGSGFNNTGWVAEGQRAARMSVTEVDVAATYKTLGEEDQASFEAQGAAQGFEDLLSTTQMRLLQKMMLKEETALLGGNLSVALGTPVTPTVANSGAGGSIAAATYNVIVVALTLEGYLNSTLVGGLAKSQVITGADGLTFTIKGGSSQKSAAAGTTTGGSTSTINASTTAIRGAVAYAWYIGTAGNEKLEAITTLNSVLVTSLAGTGENATTVTADNSTNTLGFDGLLYNGFISTSGSYFNSLATGTNGTGTFLTASGRGSVVEIDTAMFTMWNNYQVSPTVIWVNAQEQKNITTKVLTNAASPLLQYFSPVGGGEAPYSLVAGGVAAWYYNPFTTGAGYKIPILVHPTLPPGTILMYCENLPAMYISNNVPAVAQVITRRDYYSIAWPLRTRQNEYGVYAEEVLACYFPPGIGIITNIGNG